MTRPFAILGALLIVWLGAMLLLAQQAREATGALAAARQQRAALGAVADAPEALTIRWPAALTAPAASRDAALKGAADRVRSMGRIVTIDGLDPVDGSDPALVALHITAHGDAASILRFVGRLESARPGFRFAAIRMTRDDAAGGLTLDGQLVAFWQAR